MRSQKEVKDQLRQLKYRTLQRELKARLADRAANCGHNVVIVLEGGCTLGVCSIQAETGHLGCDDRIPGCQGQVKSCGWYVVSSPKEEIKAEFAARLEGDRGQLAYDGYGDIVALLWVLDDPDALTEPDPSGAIPEGAVSDGFFSNPSEGEKKQGFWSRWFGG